MVLKRWLRSFTPALFALFVLPAAAQHAIGLALDLNKDVAAIDDPGGQLRPTPRLNAALVPFYQYTFRKGFSLSLGLSLKHFKESVGLSAFNFTSSGQRVGQALLTAGHTFYLLKDKIYLSPLLGAGFNGMLFYNQGTGGSGKTGTSTDSLVFSYHTADAAPYYLTLHAGLQMGFHLSRSFSAFVFSKYTFGLSPVSRQYITYRRNQEPVQQAVQTLNGGYLTFMGLGVSYAFRPRPKAKADEQEK